MRVNGVILTDTVNTLERVDKHYIDAVYLPFYQVLQTLFNIPKHCGKVLTLFKQCYNL